MLHIPMFVSLLPFLVNTLFTFLLQWGSLIECQGERDYAGLPSKTPAWKGNHALGHSAAFDVPNAGIPGLAGRYILQWLLRGDTKGKTWFTSGGAKKSGFTDVVFKNLGKIMVNPI